MAYYVYITANKRDGVPHAGMTDDIDRRARERIYWQAAHQGLEERMEDKADRRNDPGLAGAGKPTGLILRALPEIPAFAGMSGKEPTPTRVDDRARSRNFAVWLQRFMTRYD